MAETSKIEWTDATWNPITGCSVVSPGCTNCYAMRLAGTRLQHHPSRAGLTTPTRSGPVWTGDVRLNEHWIEQPLRWRRRRNIFVCAHGDLFHKNVSFDWIDRVFEVMRQAHWHTFQVLTKRAKRMEAYVSSFKPCSVATGFMTRGGLEPASYGGGVRHAIMSSDRWPLPNVWLGTSVEDQCRADERIPHLLATPATVRFLSVEPMLDRIDLEGYLPDLDCGDGINWVICGGESGPNARDMDPEWARNLRDQCAAARVPFFHKQMARKAAIPADLLVRQWPEVAHA